MRTDKDLFEGQKFNIMKQDNTIKTIVTVKKNENFGKSSLREWLFLDENGNNHDEEWYFFNGEFMEEVEPENKNTTNIKNSISMAIPILSVMLIEQLPILAIVLSLSVLVFNIKEIKQLILEINK